MRILSIFLVFAIPIAVFGQHKQDNFAFKLDEYFTALTNLRNFNGNVLVAKDGKLLLDKTYNIGGGPAGFRVSKESQFIIASVAKVFINYSILKLAEQKRLSLDDKLSKFIPDFPNGDKITVEQLMHHRSGLPRVLTDYEKYDRLTFDQVVELAKKEKLQFEPGTETLYSNIGFTIMHYIINKASKEGYPAFTQKLLKKMKLTSTAEYNINGAPAGFVYGFENSDGKVASASEKNIKRFETGIYYSTIADMYRFSEQMMLEKNLKKSFTSKMFTDAGTLAQAGGIEGYRAYFYKDLKTRVTFIFLSNYTDIPIQEVTADIVNLLANKPYDIPKKIDRKQVAVNDAVLQRYVGKYSLAADYNQVFTITLENGTLFIADKDGEKTEMKPDSETTFFDDPKSKDGYVFTLNIQTEKYELMIISTGLKLKTKKLD